jgi:hypothetical protein
MTHKDINISYEVTLCVSLVTDANLESKRVSGSVPEDQVLCLRDVDMLIKALVLDLVDKLS